MYCYREQIDLPSQVSEVSMYTYTGKNNWINSQTDLQTTTPQTQKLRMSKIKTNACLKACYAAQQEAHKEGGEGRAGSDLAQWGGAGATIIIIHASCSDPTTTLRIIAVLIVARNGTANGSIRHQQVKVDYNSVCRSRALLYVLQQIISSTYHMKQQGPWLTSAEAAGKRSAMIV